MSDTPTHLVPEPGLASWPAPDPAQPQGPLVPARLEVRVLDWNGAWAHIRCSNGWTTWVDGRLLIPVAAPPPVPQPPLAPPPPESPRPTRPGPTPMGGVISAGAAVGVGPMTMGGAALVVVASFLPWYDFGVSASAWDLPLLFLVTGGNQLSGLKVGLLLVAVAAVVALPFVTRQPLGEPRLLLGAGVVAAAAGMAALIRLAVEQDPKPEIGVGVLLAVAGGGLIAFESWRRSSRPRA
ncbi:MAG: hypothetical protein ACRD1K_14945 [Acidimicrobiales bacterium]